MKFASLRSLFSGTVTFVGKLHPDMCQLNRVSQYCNITLLDQLVHVHYTEIISNKLTVTISYL